jgi:hypothetical protein
MKKEYIKPIIINIKTYNDNALLQTASLYDINNRDPDGNIAGEGDGPTAGDGGFIWND